MSWSAKAKELSNEYKLNELGELSLSVIKEYKGQSKSQLYRKIIDWVISMSSDAKSAIQVSNEEEGTIIARCYLPNIAKRTMGDNSYRVSIRPLIKFDFKEERIRMTYTLQNYEVLKINDDSGYVIMFGGGFGVTGNGVKFICYFYFYRNSILIHQSVLIWSLISWLLLQLYFIL